jgi:acetate kinase
MRILSLNLGSSSLKSAVHEISNGAIHCITERDVVTSSDPQSAQAATRSAISSASKAAGSIDAVGHRIVFGGSNDAPEEISQELLLELHDLQPLDPLHAPGALAVIREGQRQLTSATHVACFDTAFFRDTPETARTLTIPSDDPLLRRYGFHGLSYESVVASLGDDLHERTIIAHLGNGASLCALQWGRPVDMTMGFSPLSGIVMSTRPGDMDAGVLLYLLERSHLSVQQMRNLLETQSGLRAISGGEGNVQRLCERTDEKAVFALEMFVRSVAKAAGALATELGGLDMLVFTGGIGEHNARIREEIVSRLGFLGSNFDVRVVKSDENLSIARHVAKFVKHAFA